MDKSPRNNLLKARRSNRPSPADSSAPVNLKVRPPSSHLLLHSPLRKGKAAKSKKVKATYS